MKKDTMKNLEEAEKLVQKAVEEWKKGNLAAYNESSRKARHIIFEARYSELYDDRRES